MKKLRRNFERFCITHQRWGIPNLMLFISLGSAVVYILSLIDRDQTLYQILCFDRRLILQGQVWRLITYVFTYQAGNIFLTAVSLLCYFSLGRAMENAWGTLRFNLFYFTGVILMDIFALCFGGRADVYYLNLSLFLGYATLYPDARFLLFFFIPIKAWIFALIDLGFTVYAVIDLASRGTTFPHYLFPLIAIANYLLFFGADVLNIFPLSWRTNLRRLFRKKPKVQTKSQPASGTIPFAGSYEAEKARVKTPYTHRCTVCGRTDVSHPDLEFRYCSRCKGYFCYCEEHINSHNHIE